ncbi:MAG: histidine kinase dimerization/phospho-acceptor domain-containing protein [Pseudomonadota bacterium]
MSPYKSDNAKPFGFARTLSWVSLVLIVSSSLALAFFISTNARETLLSKQQSFALLLAENLNHQIYRRFTLPTLVGYGRIALRQPVQYKRLDDVIQATIHGLHVERLRIYDHDKVVSYSSEESDLGKTDIAPKGTDDALEGLNPSFEIAPDFSFWETMFLFNESSGEYILRTVYPLRVENRNLEDHDEGPVMGVLEITQDITGDLATVVRFQWLIVLTSLFSSLILFGLLQLFIRRADRLFAERFAEVQSLQQELHQNEKLVSMGRVIASIAHEIRNPLGIIRSSSELLLSRARKQAAMQNGTCEAGGANNVVAPKADTVSRRILEAIYDESMRLSQTVNDFLDYARPRKPVQDIVDIDIILAEAIAFLEPELRRCQVNITRDLSDRLGSASVVLSDEPVDYLTEHLSKKAHGSDALSTQGFHCQGDKGMLYRAFYNIMVNGLQAIESKTQSPTLRRLSGGSTNPSGPNGPNGRHEQAEQGAQESNTIIIATRRFWLDSLGHEFDHDPSQADDEHTGDVKAMLELTFTDSGTGFPEEIKGKLLDPFFTTKDQGTGLGLPIVNSIITSHGGSVTLDNAPQGGALVRVVLPVKQITAEA